MSLNDEIEKLIQAEKQKLELQDTRSSQLHKRQEERFAPLRRVLEELVKSVDAQFIQANIVESSARVDLGETEKEHFRVEIRWEIQPNYKYPHGLGQSDRTEDPGIIVEETTYYRYADVDQLERKYIFENERAVLDHLTGLVAKKVAAYRRSEEMAARRKGNPGF